MRAIVLAAALALVPAGISAAQTDNATPAQNLDCAVWSAVVIGHSDDEAVKNGVGMALGYFIGLYEAATDSDIEEAFLARIAVIGDEELAALDQTCGARMGAYSERLIVLGKRIQKLDEAVTAE